MHIMLTKIAERKVFINQLRIIFILYFFYVQYEFPVTYFSNTAKPIFRMFTPGVIFHPLAGA